MDPYQAYSQLLMKIEESTKTITQLVRHCVKVVKSEKVVNIQIREHVAGVPLGSMFLLCPIGDRTHTIAQLVSRCVNVVKPDNDVNIHIPEHLPSVPLEDSTHNIDQLASRCVNVVKPNNNVSIQKLSSKPYTEMSQLASRCVKVVKPENDVNIQIIFDKLYVKVQGELDEVSAIGEEEEMSWEELMSIDGSEDEQSDNNEVISENDDVLAQMIATKDTNMVT
eukprot:scaffold52669_cov40-Cyclotella_meneghiniana.AAC.9